MSKACNRINHHNHTTTTTTTTAFPAPITTAFCSSVAHIEHKRQSPISATSPTSIPHYLHNTSYGLLEPAATAKTVVRPHPHHRRKVSTSSNSSLWSDRAFDFVELKNRSFGLGGKISEKLPGVRYSATFISTLRTNLVLSTSLAPPSPNLIAFSPTLLPSHSLFDDHCLSVPRSLLAMVVEKEVSPLDGVPDLTFSKPKDAEDRTAGLKLVADVLAQQRSTTSRTLIYNPITVVLWAVLLGSLYPYVYRNPAKDKPSLVIATMGTLMCVLAGVRYLVKPYQDLAEAINWEWLGDDDMAIAKYGDTVIGTCVYRLQDSGNKSKEMLIRAWTTRPRERRRGVGRGLLEHVVDIARQKGCSGVDFAPDELRVGSTRLLTQLDGFAGIVHINKGFIEEEAKARTTLKKVLDERWSEKRTKGIR